MAKAETKTEEEAVQDASITADSLSDEILNKAKEWSAAQDAIIAARADPQTDTKTLRKAEDVARSALWLACGKNRDTFDAALEAVGKPRSKQPDAPPPVPLPRPGRAAAGPKTPYYPKRNWEPQVGHQVRVKLFEPDVFVDAVIVGYEKYGRYFVYSDEYKRTMVGKSRLYVKRDENGEVATTDVSTLPEEARTPKAGEQALQAPVAVASGNGAGDTSHAE